MFLNNLVLLFNAWLFLKCCDGRICYLPVMVLLRTYGIISICNETVKGCVTSLLVCLSVCQTFAETQKDMRPFLSLIHLNIFSLIHFFYLDSGLLTRFADSYMSESFISTGVYLYIYVNYGIYECIIFLYHRCVCTATTRF